MKKGEVKTEFIGSSPQPIGLLDGPVRLGGPLLGSSGIHQPSLAVPMSSASRRFYLKLSARELRMINDLGLIRWRCVAYIKSTVRRRWQLFH